MGRNNTGQNQKQFSEPGRPNLECTDDVGKRKSYLVTLKVRVSEEDQELDISITRIQEHIFLLAHLLT